MKNINIEKTNSTPGVQADSETGIIEISGKSYPENTAKFYQPIIDWIEDFIKLKKTGLIVKFEIQYFNSSTTKIFYNLLDMLDEARRKGKAVTVNWVYDPENENAIEAGENFQDDFEAMGINLIDKTVIT